MALLQVFKDGRKIKEFEIQPQKEWIMGRSSEVDLVLEGERGISRQHLKLQFVGGHWEGEVLSRYGELYQNSKKITKLKLEHGSRFEIPPFDFVFEDEVASESQTDAQSQFGSQHSMSSEDLSENTMIGQVPLSPFLKICDAQGSVVQIFRLEGHVWVAGRDTSCALFIDNQKFSRRHFEIRLDSGAYVIKDLESSNGTVVNGDLISTKEWTVLRSGDAINVVDWTLFFELRDSAFENKLQEISPELRNPMIYQNDSTPEPISLARISMGNSIPPPQSIARPPKKKLNFVHVLIGVILIGALAYHFSNQGKTEENQADQTKKNLSPFEKLTPQQQQTVKDTYRLADRLFKEARYEMARQEVAKIHELIPIYEESKNLEKLAEVAIQSQIDQSRAEAQEKQRIEMEEKIAQVTSECQRKLNPNIEMQTMDECLMPVLSLNPEHPAIAALKSQVDQLIAEKLIRNQKRAEYNSLVKKHKNLYEKAVVLVKAGKPLEAIPAFENVLASKLPDPKDLKGEAKRQIASIQKDLTDAQSKFEAEAEQALKKGDLKSSILTLRKAIKINPENESLQGRANSLLGELRKQMQVLYQEGILEESVGEVETAKGKWKKIIELSIPDEDYFKKAKSKLKKYGDQ